MADGTPPGPRRRNDHTSTASRTGSPPQTGTARPKGGPFTGVAPSGGTGTRTRTARHVWHSSAQPGHHGRQWQPPGTAAAHAPTTAPTPGNPDTRRPHPPRSAPHPAKPLRRVSRLDIRHAPRAVRLTSHRRPRRTLRGRPLARPRHPRDPMFRGRPRHPQRPVTAAHLRRDRTARPCARHAARIAKTRPVNTAESRPLASREAAKPVRLPASRRRGPGWLASAVGWLGLGVAGGCRSPRGLVPRAGTIGVRRGRGIPLRAARVGSGRSGRAAGWGRHAPIPGVCDGQRGRGTGLVV